MSVKLFGHSNVKHFIKFLSIDNEDYSENINSWSWSGLKTTQLLNKKSKKISNIFENFAGSLSENDFIIIFLGDNDVCEDDSAEVTAWRLLSFASLIKRKYKVASVTLHQLLPRYPGARGNYAAYNLTAGKVNEIINANCKDFGLFFLDSGFKFPGGDKNGDSKSYYDRIASFKEDGIHLSFLGNKKLKKSINHVLIQAKKFGTD